MAYLFYAIAYISGYIITLLLSLSVLCGLYFVSDLAEEHSSWALKLLRYTLFVIIILHIVVLFDGLPLLEVSVGIAAHLIYSTMLGKFPFIKIFSAQFVFASIFFAISHYVWINFFMQSTYDVLAIIGFLFAFVWLVPLGFFVSLTFEQHTLPGIYYHNSSNGTANKHGNIFKIGFAIVFDILNKNGYLNSTTLVSKKKP